MYQIMFEVSTSDEFLDICYLITKGKICKLGDKCFFNTIEEICNAIDKNFLAVVSTLNKELWFKYDVSEQLFATFETFEEFREKFAEYII